MILHLCRNQERLLQQSLPGVHSLSHHCMAAEPAAESKVSLTPAASLPAWSWSAWKDGSASAFHQQERTVVSEVCEFF